MPAARVIFAILASVAVLTGTASASSGVHRFVALPGANAPECELASSVPGLGTFVYCVVGPKHALSVEMRGDGVLHVCHGTRCLSDAPENVRILGYGTSIRVGPFRCAATRRGMRCTVIRLGHGFVLDRTGLTRI